MSHRAYNVGGRHPKKSEIEEFLAYLTEQALDPIDRNKAQLLKAFQELRYEYEGVRILTESTSAAVGKKSYDVVTNIDMALDPKDYDCLRFQITADAIYVSGNRQVPMLMGIDMPNGDMRLIIDFARTKIVQSRSNFKLRAMPGTAPPMGGNWLTPPVG